MAETAGQESTSPRARTAALYRKVSGDRLLRRLGLESIFSNVDTWLLEGIAGVEVSLELRRVTQQNEMCHVRIQMCHAKI